MAHGRHIPYLIVIQIALIIIFGCVVEYGDSSDSRAAYEKHDTDEKNRLQHYYPSKCYVITIYRISWGERGSILLDRLVTNLSIIERVRD